MATDQQLKLEAAEAATRAALAQIGAAQRMACDALAAILVAKAEAVGEPASDKSGQRYHLRELLEGEKTPDELQDRMVREVGQRLETLRRKAEADRRAKEARAELEAERANRTRTGEVYEGGPPRP